MSAWVPAGSGRSTSALLVIVLLLGCAPLPPTYSDPVANLRAAPTHARLKLGLVLSDNTRRALTYVEENPMKLTYKAFGALAQPAIDDLDSRQLLTELTKILTSRFQSIETFNTIEEARTHTPLTMLLDVRVTLGFWSLSVTTVDISGVFTDYHEEIVDSVTGKGAYTIPVPNIGTPGFRMALNAALAQFAANLDGSSRLTAFGRERGVSGAAVVAPRTGPLYTRSWAVIVGINKYEHWPPLRYAVNDARSLRRKLEELGFQEVIEVLDKEATRERLLTLLGTDLPKRVGPDDRVVIFFAGHGHTESLPRGEEGYIIPVDGGLTNHFATAISMTQLRDLSKRIPAKHLLYVMDSCYSGQGFTRSLGITPKIEGYIQKVTSVRSVQMITAGGKGERVVERQGHGIFTEYLLRGLSGEADRDFDGVVTASELGAFLKPHVSRASENEHTPQYGHLDGEGEVVFVLAVKP